MQYSYSGRVLSSLEQLPRVKDETKQCIINLLKYRAIGVRLPRRRSAAVLVPLFVGRSGELHVVLSRRSDALRTFAGDTALPGGKMDTQDLTLEDTARREAFEEIGLPQDKERLPLLCVMEPILVREDLVVTPVAVLILDYSLQPSLNSSEVASIFTRPLLSFLSSTPHLSSTRAIDPNNPYYSFTDVPSSGGNTIRFHRFLTGREAEGVRPVFGVTALILITTATIGYRRMPDFEVLSPDALTQAQRIAYTLLTSGHPLRNSCKSEGIDTNESIALLLCPPVASNAVRNVEWEKIGVQWKSPTRGEEVTDVVSLVNRIERYVNQGKEWVDEEGGHGSKDFGEGNQDTIPDRATLVRILDRMQDMVNEQMKQLERDEQELASARNAYQKIQKDMPQVRKGIEMTTSSGCESGKIDLMALLDIKEGMRRHVKEMIGGHGPGSAQALAKKRNARL